MTKRVHPGSSATYDAADRFVAIALRRDDSLFTPGREIWGAPVVEDLWNRFVNQPDQSSDSFVVKLERQLSDAPDETIQLMAENVFVHFLVAADMKPKTKRSLVTQILSWMTLSVDVPPDLESAFSSGIANTGTAFKTYRPFQLFFLVNFIRQWKSVAPPERDLAMRDPWTFKTMVAAVHAPAAQSQQSALLHLVHPDVFEPIVSQNHKRLIVKAFGGTLDELPDDVDRAIHDIRKLLTPKHGQDFNFYASEIKSLWERSSVKTDPDAWDAFIEWARRWREWPLFDQEERSYKIALAEQLEEARRALHENSDWVGPLTRTVAGSSNNLLHFTTKDNFKNALTADTAAFDRALRRMWHYNQEGPQGRLAGFWSETRHVLQKRADRRALGFFLLSAVNVRQFPPFKPTAYLAAYDLTRWPAPATTAKATNVYSHALTFLDRLIAEAAERGVPLRDRLDAQSVVWCITKWPEQHPPEGWSDEEWRALLEYRAPGEEPPGEGPREADSRPESMAALANELLLDEDFFRRAQDLLADKRQLVFYGPPGTGKTYVARRFADQLARDGSVVLVQFHPSYSYEDFVEGYRPRDVHGQPGFKLVEGPLKRIARAAASAPGQPHVLIIDELNRGNVAKVFGELYFLLEYRNEEVSLQYSEEPFRLPPNLFLICTMNTADRSIALIDAALRRRFHFVPFFPQLWPVQGLLGRWLARHNPDLSWIATAVDRANEQVDRNAAIGPSHFMRPDLSEDKIALVWEHSVIPYIEEVYFDDERRVDEFRLELLLADASMLASDGSLSDETSDTD